MNYVLDILIVLALFIGLFIGMKRGIIHQVLSLAAYVASFIIAKVGSKFLAAGIYEGFIRTSIEKSITERINEIFGATVSSASGVNVPNIVSEVVKGLPAFLRDSVSIKAVEIGSVQIGSVAEISSSIANLVFYPVIIVVLANVLFILLFIISTIIFKILIKMSGIVKKIPGVRQINKFLGGILGLAITCVLTVVVVKFIGMGLSLSTSGSFIGLTEAIVNQTFIFKLIQNI